MGFRLRLRSRSVLQAVAMALLLAGLVMGQPSITEAASPIANAGGPYSGDEGQQVTFTGDASDAEDPTSSLTFEWDFEFDGSFAVGESGVNLTSPKHTYTDNGSFTVALRVKDTGSNVSSVSTAAVTISNVPPTPSAGGPYTVDEGSSLSYAGSATDPGNDTLTYEWDFDYDNSTFTVDASGDDLTAPSNTYLNDANKTVALRVRDDDGGVSSIVTASVTVSNVPPTANAGTSYTEDEGSSITFSGTATDPGNETLTYEWDFTYSGGSFNVDDSGSGLTTPSHTYTADGDFTVALRVRDDDSVSNIATASVSITNVLPTVNAGGPYSGNLGGPVTFAGTATDPGGEALTYEWDFEYDGNTFNTVGATTDEGVSLTAPSYTYTGGGSYTVALRVSDDDGTSAIVTSTVTIGGATATPTPAPTATPVSGGGGGGGGGGGLVKTKTPTPKPTRTPTPAPTSTPAPKATATPVPVYESEEVTSTLSTEVTASTEELDNLENALTTVLGTEVDVLDSDIEVFKTDDGLIITRMLVTGVANAQAIVGELDVALGNLVIETVDGLGTASLALDIGLSVVGNATVEVVDGAVEVAMSDLHLVFEPEAPDASTLDGGSPDVTEFGVSFNVGLSAVPDNATLAVVFVKSSAAFSDDDDDAIRQATADLGFSIQDSENDIAFAVNVDKGGIADDELGANSVTMSVSKAWYDRKLAEGKAIAITKINDLGVGFSSLALCAVTGDSVSCNAEFSGEASGFSLFVLMGVSGEATPTATVTQPATATTVPAATSTPKPLEFTVSTSTPWPTATSTSVPSTSTPFPTSTAIPPTSTRTTTPAPTATPVVTASASTSTSEPGEDSGFPVAAFIGIAVGALALFGGAGVYLWKTGQFLILLSFWRRFSETGR